MNDIATAATLAAGATGWEAKLELCYERRGDRTVLGRRVHRGPLVVQKSLYPEGDAVCQNIIVHPPAGIVGGDRLALEVTVGERARVQITTPGAAKWYRSAGKPAHQSLSFSVATGALLEWLPQETIVFDGAMPELETHVALAGDAKFFGWEIVCLGRRLAGERFASGRLSQDVTVRRDGARQWIECTRLSGGSRLLETPVGLERKSVFGTFLAAAPCLPENLMATCREVGCDDGEVAVTRVPGVLLARYRGQSPEAARKYFVALWARVRPVLAGLDAVLPRIWTT
jgi:urease accessory protein